MSILDCLRTGRHRSECREIERCENCDGSLRGDKKIVVSAASRAQKAVEFIMGSQDPEPGENVSEA